MEFCSEVELGNHFVATILDVLISCKLGAISDQTSLNYNIYTGPSGIQVLDFQCSRAYITKFLNGEFDLVSSENHKVVNFISTDDNPTFLINKAAVEFFEHLHKDLEELKNNVKGKKLVITGLSLGGYIAILFTLWLHHGNDNKRMSGSEKTTRPICITFGSPLIGDKAFESVISKHPEWKSSFLSVVSTTDPFACFYSSDTSYKPFGTFLFCTLLGWHTTFEDGEAILAVLNKMASSRSRSDPRSSRPMHDYMNELSLVRSKIFHRGVICELPNEVNSNSLKAGITLQFRDIGIFDMSPDLINKLVEGKREKMTKSMGTLSDEKKLNKMKIDMAFMELFISSMRSGAGYYDCYKSDPKREEKSFHYQIIESHGRLNQYWEEFVKKRN
ncbi:senescence-associated carboxylesterase 101-like [Bidens hawaiensis]|uniref:senescence-associated carboxylesterase 101-like n=1 Tax=Bidens hawaiensis TaxID=980011 RepID=UPI0040497A75